MRQHHQTPDDTLSSTPLLAGWALSLQCKLQCNIWYMRECQQRCQSASAHASCVVSDSAYKRSNCNKHVQESCDSAGTTLASLESSDQHCLHQWWKCAAKDVRHVDSRCIYSTIGRPSSEQGRERRTGEKFRAPTLTRSQPSTDCWAVEALHARRRANALLSFQYICTAAKLVLITACPSVSPKYESCCCCQVSADHCHDSNANCFSNAEHAAVRATLLERRVAPSKHAPMRQPPALTQEVTAHTSSSSLNGVTTDLRWSGLAATALGVALELCASLDVGEPPAACWLGLMTPASGKVASLRISQVSCAVLEREDGA